MNGGGRSPLSLAARPLLSAPRMNRLQRALLALCVAVDILWLAEASRRGANVFAWGSERGAEAIARPGIAALCVELAERGGFVGAWLGILVALVLSWRRPARELTAPLGAMLGVWALAAGATLIPLFALAPELHACWQPNPVTRAAPVAATSALAAFALLAPGRPAPLIWLAALPAPALAWASEQLGSHHFLCFHVETQYPAAATAWRFVQLLGPLAVALTPAGLRWRSRRGARRSETPSPPARAARADGRAPRSDGSAR